MSGASSTLIKNGQTLISSHLDMSKAGSSSSGVQAQMDAAARRVQHLVASNDIHDESSLSLKNSDVGDVYKQYMAQIQNIDQSRHMQ